MTLFKKYGLKVLIFLLWAIILLYFNPRQNEFYLVSDLGSFEKKSRLALFFLELVLLCIFLIFLIRARKPVQQLFNGVIFSIVLLAIFFLFFHRTFTAIGLYINRQTASTAVSRRYVAGYINNGEKDKDNFYLYDIANRHITTENNLIESLYRPDLHPNDTLQMEFRKGLLGVEYFYRPGEKK